MNPVRFWTQETKNLILALAVLILTGRGFRELMLLFQSRSGSVFPDPIHALFGPYALHLPIFLITYLPIAVGIALVIRRGGVRENLIYAYCLLQLFRCISIYLLPLEAPPAMIVLNDPISDHLVFGSVVTKDLFFSGHVSALVLFSFFMPTRTLRYTYRFLALFDAILLTAQHVHYSIDVVAAPFFAFGAFKLQAYLKSRTRSLLSENRPES